MSTAHKKRAVKATSTFRKDLDRAKKHRKCDLAELKKVMGQIEAREPLDQKYKDHSLQGRYPDQKGGFTDCRECHTSNDWLLVYRFPDDDTVHFIRCGTHSELF